MKKIAVVLFFLHNCIKCKAQVIQNKTIDQLLGERYAFGVFENFGECANIYNAEAVMLRNLSKFRFEIENGDHFC